MADWTDDLPLECGLLVARIVAEAPWPGVSALEREVRDDLMRREEGARPNGWLHLGTAGALALGSQLLDLRC